MNNLFKALNDKTRRDILTLLKDKDMSAGEIADQFYISKPSISHHLDLLKSAGLVDIEKKGQFIIYSINTTVMEDLLQWLITFKPHKDEQQSKERASVASDNSSATSLPSISLD